MFFRLIHVEICKFSSFFFFLCCISLYEYSLTDLFLFRGNFLLLPTLEIEEISDHCEDEKMKVKKGNDLTKVIQKVVETGLEGK